MALRQDRFTDIHEMKVKDVNFYGLNDEYVVSGSDCGHLFICKITDTV